ncbi:mucin-19 [Dorcoceras hygrometricum]|uniref:Mucin-19 n=1 Tax=Dorcoceras hygrometricum TaxID=472368 RepID=A0A2Z7B454_9LAMI|nr:mucin-19 [Dorcoceras hygrometricum]
MNSNYGKSSNKAGSISSFDFDVGLGSGRSKPMKDQKSQTSSYASTTYSQKPNATSSWNQQPNKTSWTHQPAAAVQSGGVGLSGPTSMVGDIFGKSWNSTAPALGVGIVQNKNPSLFGDLLNSALGQNKGSNNVPLKKAARPGSQTMMGGVADSLPKSGISTQTSGSWGSNASNSSGNVNFSSSYNTNSSLGGGNVNLGGNSYSNPNHGGSSMKSMAGGNKGGGGMGSNKDPFESFVDFGSKKPDIINSARKESDKSGSENNLFGDFPNSTSQTRSQFSSDAFSSSKADPIGDFGFVTQSESQPARQPSRASDFDTFFSSTSDGGSQGNEGFTNLSGADDWGIDAEFGGGADAGGTTELEGLPPPPVGVTAPSAKNKGMDNYKQGQYADAIKWLSWAIILFEKAGDSDGTMEVLTCRASCFKEVGEYKKAVADCTKVLDHDGTNVSVLVQRSLLYESMEFRIKLSTKYSYNMMASYIEEHVHITDDNSLQFMLDLPTLGCLYLYVETLPVEDDVTHVDDPQSLIPIITQGFRTMDVDDKAGPSTYHGDRHEAPTLSGSNMQHA